MLVIVGATQCVWGAFPTEGQKCEYMHLSSWEYYNCVVRCCLQGERISSVSEKLRAKLDVPPKEFDKVG